MFTVVPIETPTLGDRSYLVHDGSVAFVVDPQRDVDRVLDQAAQAAVTITDVFETHVHNDYLTGGKDLAERCGARYHLNGLDPVGFQRQPLADGDVVTISEHLAVQVVATPGHTHTHLAYLLDHGGKVVAAFTGGSLLYGSTGRPDLLGPEHTDELVHAQWASTRRLADAADEDAAVWPTHGFGSFCSSSQSDVSSSTIAGERASNPVLSQPEDAWVAATLAGLDAYPAYYAHIAPVNLAGPSAADLSPAERVGAADLRERLGRGEWVVDLRSRAAFCAGHLDGSFSFGLDGNMATYLGWVIPWGTPLTVLGGSPEEVAVAQRELCRIGIDRPAAATGGPADWLGTDAPRTLPRATFADLADALHHRPVVVLDVRRRSEWDASHLEGALHIPLHDLPARAAELPDAEVWVHCGSGYRATIAASLLETANHRLVVVDEAFTAAASAGLALVGPSGTIDRRR